MMERIRKEDIHPNIRIGCHVNSSFPHEWREPRHQEFHEREARSPLNSPTEARKDGNLAELPKRTEALHGLLDVAVG